MYVRSDQYFKHFSGLNVDNIMNFCVQALNHTAADVRVVAERIVKGMLILIHINEV